MASLNKTTLIGNMVKAAQIRHTNSGEPITNFSLVTQDEWSEGGQKMTAPEYHRITVTGELAQKVVATYGKGDLVLVIGKLKTGKRTDEGGVQHYSTEIIVESTQLLRQRYGQEPMRGKPAKRQS